MMNIELTRVKVKNGKSAKVDEWLQLLHNEIDKVLLTLEAEKMYVETIFREFTENGEFLYWYSIQGDGGASLHESDFEIDKLHIAYWEECIDEDYEPVHMKKKVSMIQDKVLAVLQ